jgi:hypothetical protein
MKSIELLFNESLEALKSLSTSKHDEVFNSLPKGAPIEVKLNRVAEALAELTGLTFTEVNRQLNNGDKFTIKESASNVESIDEAKRDYAFFGLAPRKEVIKEVTRIPKNNGASDNGHGEAITEVDRTTTKKEALVQSAMRSTNMSEAEVRATLGLKPKSPDGLTKQQVFEYRFAKAIGLSEADAMNVAKLTNIREVNTNPRY